MNEFESRYFPFKRFSRRHLKFSRSRDLQCAVSREYRGQLQLKQLQLAALHPAAKGKKLAFISDWHWHNSPRQQQLLSELSDILAAQKPDILLLGGDLCDDAVFLPELPALLSELAKMAPAIFAVNGNWEAGKRWLSENYFAELYAKYNIKLLENNSVICGAFCITGLPDISSVNFRIPENPPSTDALTGILLVHNPDTVIAAARDKFLKNFSLAFCGHTHGGQIRLPLAGAIYCPSFYHCKFDCGVFDCRDLPIKMVISSGISEHHNSFRLFCPPEIIIAEFN